MKPEFLPLGDCGVRMQFGGEISPAISARTWLKDRNIRVNVLSPGQIATSIQEQVFDEETKRQFESLILRGKTLWKYRRVSTLDRLPL